MGYLVGYFIRKDIVWCLSLYLPGKKPYGGQFLPTGTDVL
jgi:hypothetical protein